MVAESRCAWFCEVSRLACLSKYFWTSVPQCCGASKHLQQAIPRCGPEEINYVEARCPQSCASGDFRALGRDSVLARQFPS